MGEHRSLGHPRSNVTSLSPSLSLSSAEQDFLQQGCSQGWNWETVRPETHSQ